MRKKRKTTTQTTKVCNRCKIEKSITEFYRRPDRASVEPWCKECRKVYNRAQYQKNNALILQQNRDRKIANRDTTRTKNHEYYRNNTAQYAAQGVVSRSGAAVSEYQCKVCGKTAQEFHHWSYETEHQLSVVPLCRSCHKRWHEGTLNVVISQSDAVQLSQQ